MTHISNLSFRAKRRISPGITRYRIQTLGETRRPRHQIYSSAVTVISTCAPAGRAVTPTVVRPGGVTVKYSA